MTIQAARAQLQTDLEELLDDDEPWKITSLTKPDIFHRTIVIGHADRIEPRTFADYFADVRVTCYVSEAEEATAVDDLYGLVSLDTGTLLVRLRDLGNSDGRYASVKSGNVGPRSEGPSEFLAGEIQVRLRIDNA